MWIRIGAVALCFPGPGKCRRPMEEGCVFTGQDKAVVVPGDRGLRERGSARWRFSHTVKDGEREGERMGEWGSGERERTLPGGSFFLSAIINGILPLTHSSLRQTKDPAFQCSLTGQPASHPAIVEPHHSPHWTKVSP